MFLQLFTRKTPELMQIFYTYIQRKEVVSSVFLLETTKAIDILELVNSFFAKQNFDWKKNLVTLCTDGALAMLGNMSGLMNELTFVIQGTDFTIMNAL